MSASPVKAQSVSLQASGPAIDSPQQHERIFRADGPSQRELILLWLLSLICFLMVLTHFRSYTAEILKIGDNEQDDGHPATEEQVLKQLDKKSKEFEGSMSPDD